MIDYDLIINSLPKLLEGALVSLQITLLAMLLGVVFGTILGFFEEAKNPLIRVAIFGYVNLLRGTPMLVQILFLYYVLPQFGIVLAPFWAAACAIGLNSSAYVSQIVRSGINAIPRGQIDAAKTLGLSPLAIRLHVMLPQVVQITLPALGNELVTLVKDSSLASIIGVMELSKEASIIRGRTYDAFSILLAVSLIYLVLTTTISFCVSYYERKKSYAAS